jgi:superfamily II DNA or RNA helicase
MTLPLRPYQAEDLEKIEQAWATGTRRPAVVWATGLGKTILFSTVAARFHERTGRRVVILAHRTELIRQAHSKLQSVAPHLPLGIVQAELNQTLKPIILSSPQTLKSVNRRRQLMNVGLIIADECHHYAAPSYRDVLFHFLDLDPSAVALGVTATMSRSDRRSLGAVWDRVVAERHIDFGISEGFLVKPRGERVRVDDLDMRAVRRKGKDYDPDALGDALTASMAPKRIAEALTEHARHEKTVVFAPNIESADVIAEECRDAGFRTESVNYKTPAGRRRDLLESHADEATDSTQVVCNAMVLTEGWDNPLCSTAVLARKTTNNGLYIQMVGRVLRPYPGKTSALVLDVCGTTEVNTLQAQIDLFGPPEDDDTLERDPCVCSTGGPVSFALSLAPAEPGEGCTCRRRGCTQSCACGGKPGPFQQCGCVWLERVVLEPDDPVYADGRLVTEAVDLFHGSRNMWLSTAGGTHFIAAGERYIAIVPGEVVHTWDVVAMHRYRAGDPNETRYVQRGVTDLGFAQAWAEADVRPGEGSTAARERDWRARRPSEAQWARARAAGITRGADGSAKSMLGEVYPDVHQGELSNMITRAEATQRMDYRVAYLKAGQRHG